MQCFVDCKSTNAAVEDSDGKVAVQVSVGLGKDLRNFHSKAGNGVVDEFVSFVEELSVTVSPNYLDRSLSRIHVPDSLRTKLQPQCSLALDWRLSIAWRQYLYRKVRSSVRVTL